MYFDYASTSIKRKNAISNLIENLDEYQGNPSSIHALGKKTKIHLEEAREKIASYIGANPKNVIFTSGATESNNMILNNFDDKDFEIITTNIEHKSILESLEHSNSKVIYLKAGENGEISIDDLKKMISPQTKLVSIMYVNNETGVIQPIEEISELLKDTEIWLHVDAVQALGHIHIDVEKLGVDSMSFSGHKIGGLNGFGVLYTKNKLKNLIYGGSQESGRRAGTSNTISAVSMANSLDELDEDWDHVSNIKKYFLEKLEEIPFEINGDIEKTTNHIVNLYFPWVKSDLLLTYLDLNGIYVSAGSACNANTLEPSYVIENMYDSERAERSIRFSFGFTNTKDEIDTLIEKLKEMYIRKR